jgi:hypothetical protein
MHVDDDQALGVFGEDVDALELRQGVAEGRKVGGVGRGFRRGRNPPHPPFSKGGGVGRQGVADHAVIRGGFGGVQGHARLAPTGQTGSAPSADVIPAQAGIQSIERISGRNGLRRRPAGKHTLRLAALPAQGLLQGMKHELVYRLALTEAHLGLGRVDIDVDAFGRQFQEQGIGRVALVMQDIAIRLAHRVVEQLVAHETAIDVTGTGYRRRRGCRPAVRTSMPDRRRSPAGASRLRAAWPNSSPSTRGCAPHRPAPGRARSPWRCGAVQRPSRGAPAPGGFIASSQWPYSVAGVFRNLRRAGVLKNRSRTSTTVPLFKAAGSGGWTRPS